MATQRILGSRWKYKRVVIGWEPIVALLTEPYNVTESALQMFTFPKVRVTQITVTHHRSPANIRAYPQITLRRSLSQPEAHIGPGGISLLRLSMFPP